MDSDLHTGLFVTIRGDSASLVTAADQGGAAIKGFEGVSQESFDSLTRAILKLDLDIAGFTTNTEVSMKRAGTAAQEEGAQVQNFADRLLQHNYAVARGLEAVGLSTEASAARVGGALEAVKASMMGLNPALFAVVAGASAV